MYREWSFLVCRPIIWLFIANDEFYCIQKSQHDCKNTNKKTVAFPPMPAHPQPFSAVSGTWCCPFSHLSACSRCALSVVPLPGTAVHAETKVLLSKEALRTFKSTQQILKCILWTQPWTRPRATEVAGCTAFVLGWESQTWNHAAARVDASRPLLKVFEEGPELAFHM